MIHAICDGAVADEFLMSEKRLFMIVGLVAVGAVTALDVASPLSIRTRASSPARQPTGEAAASGPHLKWKFNTDNNSAVASIVLGKDGTIFAGANNAIYAIAPDGTRQWKTTLAGFDYLAAER